MQNTSIQMENAKDNIVFQLVNVEQNQELLKNVSHREFQDLSSIYRWVVGVDKTGIQSTVIQNALAKEMGFGEEQLFRFAAENTVRILPPRNRNMNEVVQEMFSKDAEEQN